MAKRPPVIAAMRSTEYADVTDADLAARYLAADAAWRAANNAGAPDEELDRLESQCFRLDEELAARGLPLPKAGD